MAFYGWVQNGKNLCSSIPDTIFAQHSLDCKSYLYSYPIGEPKNRNNPAFCGKGLGMKLEIMDFLCSDNSNPSYSFRMQ
jgi:hypothetical protein